MKKFVVKLRCCSNAVILMLFAILGATKEKNTFGYKENMNKSIKV